MYIPEIFSQFGYGNQIICAVSTGGNMSLSDTFPNHQSVQIRRRDFEQELVGECGARFARMTLVHGTIVQPVEDSLPLPNEQADVMVTGTPGTYLWQNVADCLAICIFDPEHQLCMQIHAGYAGVHRETIRSAIDYLVSRHATNPARLLAYMPPAQQAASSLFSQLLKPEISSSDWGFFRQKIRLHGEMQKIHGARPFRLQWGDRAYSQLIGCGLLAHRIERSDVDTYTAPDLFSHSQSSHDKTAPKGRQAVVFGMRFTIQGVGGDESEHCKPIDRPNPMVRSLYDLHHCTYRRADFAP